MCCVFLSLSLHSINRSHEIQASKQSLVDRGLSWWDVQYLMGEEYLQVSLVIPPVPSM